jgi:hypothetical protein
VADLQELCYRGGIVIEVFGSARLRICRGVRVVILVLVFSMTPENKFLGLTAEFRLLGEATKSINHLDYK